MTTTLAPQRVQQFLQFQISEDSQAMLPSHQLSEVLSLPLSDIVAVPEMATFVMGVCNWRGEVLWLVDLAALMESSPLANEGLYRNTYNTLIIHHQGRSVGLVVSRVKGMVRCDISQIQTTLGTSKKHITSPYIQGYWLDSNQEANLVLDGTRILDSLDS
jgi:positive phototaxis protein PixI